MSEFNDKNRIISDQAQLQSNRRRIDETLKAFAKVDKTRTHPGYEVMTKTTPGSNSVFQMSGTDIKEVLRKEIKQLVQNEAIIYLKDTLGRLPLDTYMVEIYKNNPPPISICNMDYDIVSRLIPFKENADVLVGYFLKMIAHRPHIALRLSDEFREVMCAFSWPLPLHPCTEVDIIRNTVTVAGASYPIQSRNLFSTVARLDFCCSHVKRIRGENKNPHLAYHLQRQREQAFGKIGNSERSKNPKFDLMKEKIFNSWSYPVNLVSVFYMREMGEMHINPNLMNNIMRCQRAEDVYLFP